MFVNYSTAFKNLKNDVVFSILERLPYLDLSSWIVKN